MDFNLKYRRTKKVIFFETNKLLNHCNSFIYSLDIDNEKNIIEVIEQENGINTEEGDGNLKRELSEICSNYREEEYLVSEIEYNENENRITCAFCSYTIVEEESFYLICVKN